MDAISSPKMSPEIVELWVPLKIPNHDSLFVSSQGRIMKESTKQITIGDLNDNNQRVFRARVIGKGLRNEGRVYTYLVHDLVRKGFLTMAAQDRIVKFIDGNQYNNNPKNLITEPYYIPNIDPATNEPTLTIPIIDQKMLAVISCITNQNTDILIYPHQNITSAQSNISSAFENFNEPSSVVYITPTSKHVLDFSVYEYFMSPIRRIPETTMAGSRLALEWIKPNQTINDKVDRDLLIIETLANDNKRRTFESLHTAEAIMFIECQLGLGNRIDIPFK